MPLRIGFDLDGTLADFAGAFHDVEVRLIGAQSHVDAGHPEKEKEGPEAVEADRRTVAERRERERDVKEGRRRRDANWNAIRTTPNFWTFLKPTDPEAVRRIHALPIQHKWEVFFITQRPYTDGDTVQRQSQRWLIEQGFDMPSVLVIGG